MIVSKWIEENEEQQPNHTSLLMYIEMSWPGLMEHLNYRIVDNTSIVKQIGKGSGNSCIKMELSCHNNIVEQEDARVGKRN